MLGSTLSRRILVAGCRSRYAIRNHVVTTHASKLTMLTNDSFLLQHNVPTGNTTRRFMSDLPYHNVIGMPALSPTMESGVIATWHVEEGQSFIAGDSLAEIETDKATMAFEAQDDGFIAKILVEAGRDEIKVNEPIMVTVEEEEDVGAFKDFKLEKKVEEPAPVVKEEASPPPPPPAKEAPPMEKTAAAPPPPPAQKAPAPSPPPEPTSVDSSAGAATPQWGELAKTASPIAKSLSDAQKRYVELYGSTGQTPLEV